MNRRPHAQKRAFQFPIVTAVTAVFLFAASVWAKDDSNSPTDSEKKSTVKVEPIEGKSYEGEYVGPKFQLKTEYGKIEYDVSKLKSIAIRTSESGETAATFELIDHTRFQGKLQTPSITIRKNDQNVDIETQKLKSLHFIKKKPFTLFAVIFGLLTLSMMEIVLGVDNIIFLAILVDKLPQNQQRPARNIGLAAALGTRLLLLFSLSWLLGLTRPIFTLPELPFLTDPESRDISWRDLILVVGGLFLIANSVRELHHKIESSGKPDSKPEKAAKFASIIIQIAIMDIIFSLDSVITAVGMVEEVWIMVIAMIISMIVMLFFAKTISNFVNRNPTIKVLALSFLILIGVLLVAESLGQHIDKGYIYFAMAFAVSIEFINMKLRKPQKESILPVT